MFFYYCKDGLSANKYFVKFLFLVLIILSYFIIVQEYTFKFYTKKNNAKTRF